MSSPRRRILFAILALALVLRLAHLWAVRDQPFFSWLAMDSQEYDRWAQGIAAGDWLGSQVFFQAPLYPYLLAVAYTVLGHRLALVYLLQTLLAVAGCWALYRAGREMADERTGLGAALLAAVYGPFLFYDAQLLKESLAVTATCFLLWTLAAARSRPGLKTWIGAGALLGVLALLRENALLLVPFLLPLAWRREDRWPGLARRGGALAAGLVLALLPVALRNGVVGGDFLPTTSQGGVNFYIGNNARADGTYQPIVPGKQIPELERREPARLAEQALGRPLSPGEVSRYWLDQALGWAREHPGDFLGLQLRKLGMFWSWYEWPDAVDYYYVKTLSPALRLPLLEFGGAVILALAGLFLARRRLGAFAPALLFALGWMASTVIFFLFSRYRLPAVPALLVLGGAALAEIRGRRAIALAGGLPGRLPAAARGRFRAADGPRALQPRPSLRGAGASRRGRRALPGGAGAQSTGLPRLPEPGEPRRPPAGLARGAALLSAGGGAGAALGRRPEQPGGRLAGDPRLRPGRGAPRPRPRPQLPEPAGAPEQDAAPRPPRRPRGGPGAQPPPAGARSGEPGGTAAEGAAGEKPVGEFGRNSYTRFVGFS